jgi:hypothetical protein
MLSASVLGIVCAIAYFVVAERMYTVDLVAIPARHDQDFSAAMGGAQALGGIGTLLGFDAGQTEQVREGMAILRSRLFIEEFIEQNNLMPTLFAEEWDADNGAWIDPKRAPSMWDAFTEFSNNIYTVSESPAEGTIRISMTWRDSEPMEFLRSQTTNCVKGLFDSRKTASITSGKNWGTSLRWEFGSQSIH